MIKTYSYNELQNNVSLTLTGSAGNSMRYNFTHGNTYTRKHPEITLRNKYAQDLLESHDLFKSGKVSLLRSSVDPNEVVVEEEKTDTTQNTAKTEDNTEAVPGVRTSDEVIAYVNERFDKDTRTLATAMKVASKAGITFPDFGE